MTPTSGSGRLTDAPTLGTELSVSIVPDGNQAPSGGLSVSGTGVQGIGDHVVLLAEDGSPIGTHPRADVHTEDTPLHLAFSCYLRDEQGQVLITRRALGKRAWPGVWSNACCGHPRAGEAVVDGLRRRVAEELGAVPSDVRVALPAFRYRAVDASGVVENEICPVFAATVERESLRPDPAEVMETAWVAWPDLVRAAATVPALLSPWSVLQLRELAELDDPWAGPPA